MRENDEEPFDLYKIHGAKAPVATEPNKPLDLFVEIEYSEELPIEENHEDE